MESISKDKYDFIRLECKKFIKETGRLYDVEPNEIIHTYFYPNEILYDWDEGKNNDPFWDEETNTHSVVSFINKTVQRLKVEF